MRARRWPATLRSPIEGYWSAADRARWHVARHHLQTGPNNLPNSSQVIRLEQIGKALRDVAIMPNGGWRL